MTKSQYGSDPLKARAERLAQRPRCGYQWWPHDCGYYLADGQHMHTCRRNSRHVADHRCNCGSTRKRADEPKER